MYQQVLDWFREEKNIYIQLWESKTKPKGLYTVNMTGLHFLSNSDGTVFKAEYYAALNVAIKKALTFIK